MKSNNIAEYKYLKKNYTLIILPIISFLGGIWQGQYTDDGYHWGFIFSNALNLIDGKEPYNEIFIQYGFFSTLLNSLVLYIFKKNIISLIFLTCFFYSLSIYFIGILTQKFTLNKYYAFLSTLIIFLIYPWPTTPWPYFQAFFFSILFCFFYSYNKKKYSIYSGISLGLALLSFTTVYNFILLFFTSFVIGFLLVSYKKISNDFIKKNIYFLASLILTILIFIIYLLINGLFNTWLLYLKLPFLQASIAERSIFANLIDYLSFLIFYSTKNFIDEPQWIIYATFFTANIIFIIIMVIKIYVKKNYSNDNLNLLFINVFIFSLNIIAQILGIDKFATSISLGVVPLIILINLIKFYENKFILNFILIFISIYSFSFAFALEGSKYGDSRTAYFKDLKNMSAKYNQKKIPYFVNQKWSKDSWHALDEFIIFQNNIKKKCNLKYGANLTNNTFFFVLLDYDKIQKIPFFFKETGTSFRNHFEPTLISKLQKEVDKNNIILASAENNHKLLNLDKYADPHRINMNITSNTLNKYVYIFIPKKCL